MEKYVKYLLADIAAATKNVPVLTLEDPDEEMPFITVEEEEKTARWEPLGQWMGLKREWFPPACRLTDEQLARIMKAFKRCLYAFGFIPHFPTGLPMNRQYDVAVDYLSQRVPILVYNSYQLDFCSYEPKTCPFGKQYCQCKVYEQWLTRFNDDDEEDILDIRSNLEDLPPLFFQEEEEEEGFYDELDDYLDEEEWEDDEEDDFPFGFDFGLGPDDERLN